MTNTSTFARWRVPVASMAAALVAVLLVGFTPQGQTAASAFLAQFRSEKLQPVTLTQSQADNFERTFEQLEHLGTVTAPKHPEPKTVASLAEASSAVGFAVKLPGVLPSGVSATPKSIQFMQGWEARFTFDKAKAEAYYKAQGTTGVSLPAKFDKATLIVAVPSAVVVQYPSTAAAGSTSQSEMGLVMVQANDLTAGVEGTVTLDEMREFVLNLPGLDPQTVAQLKAIQDWKTTLPIPVPSNSEVLWQQTTVAGVQGLLLNDNSGLGSAAVWRKDGRIFAVAGATKATEITKVADGLK